MYMCNDELDQRRVKTYGEVASHTLLTANYLIQDGIWNRCIEVEHNIECKQRECPTELYVVLQQEGDYMGR